MYHSRDHHTGDSEKAKKENLQHCDIHPPGNYNRDVPEELDSIILKLLSRDPNQRYFSAANTASDLERIEVVGKSTMLSELYRDLFHPVRKKTGQMQAAEEKEEELDELDELTNEEPVGTIYDSQPIMNQAAAVKTAPAKKRKTPLLMVLGGAAVAIAAIVLVMVLPKILGEKETNPEPAPRLDVETPSKPDEVEVAGSVETKPTEPAVVE